MTNEQYNRYYQLIDKRYGGDIHDKRRYASMLKLMSWRFNNPNKGSPIVE